MTGSIILFNQLQQIYGPELEHRVSPAAAVQGSCPDERHQSADEWSRELAAVFKKNARASESAVHGMPHAWESRWARAYRLPASVGHRLRRFGVNLFDNIRQRR